MYYLLLSFALLLLQKCTCTILLKVGLIDVVNLIFNFYFVLHRKMSSKKVCTPINRKGPITLAFTNKFNIYCQHELRTLLFDIAHKSN